MGTGWSEHKGRVGNTVVTDRGSRRGGPFGGGPPRIRASIGRSSIYMVL